MAKTTDKLEAIKKEHSDLFVECIHAAFRINKVPEDDAFELKEDGISKIQLKREIQAAGNVNAESWGKRYDAETKTLQDAEKARIALVYEKAKERQAKLDADEKAQKVEEEKRGVVWARMTPDERKEYDDEQAKSIKKLKPKIEKFCKKNG